MASFQAYHLHWRQCSITVCAVSRRVRCYVLLGLSARLAQSHLSSLLAARGDRQRTVAQSSHDPVGVVSNQTRGYTGTQWELDATGNRMTDRLSPERRSWLMSRIAGRNTGPELLLRRALYATGVRGWRLHRKDLPGKPDIAFGRHRLAVFVDGAFWHGHSSKFSPGRLPPEWEKKIAANRERDRRAETELGALGWSILRIWDFEVRKDPLRQAERVALTLATRCYPPPVE